MLYAQLNTCFHKVLTKTIVSILMQGDGTGLFIVVGIQLWLSACNDAGKFCGEMMVKDKIGVLI